MSMSEDTFARHRSLLFTVAYEMLGSASDAEDVVQETWLRWADVDHATVREPRAYLMTTVTHLCMDLRTSARARHETYPGPWLPEPVATERLGPLESAELRDTVAYATLHLMERRFEYEVFERKLKMTVDRQIAVPSVRFDMDAQTIEAFVFPLDGIRQAPISPLDGKPMRRAAPQEVMELSSSDR
jgi:hypothetical protein